MESSTSGPRSTQQGIQIGHNALVLRAAARSPDWPRGARAEPRSARPTRCQAPVRRPRRAQPTRREAPARRAARARPTGSQAPPRVTGCRALARGDAARGAAGTLARPKGRGRGGRVPRSLAAGCYGSG
ncbi:hypothetical protein PAHAL_6G126300 [Panicum hallii]|uniref:Uncharacterized protein n=1 Tax=Panicum hallii TaxID=206008 RepID=A0A2T8IG32_9POAL|nr:hypothetical protein PAHAL_6G126300 [Panicum hallii]